MMFDKFEIYCNDNQIIENNDCIIVGVSGGADSMCLLAMLIRFRALYGIEIVVVHVNHLIRENAIYDAKYVEEYCSRNNLEYIYFQYDVREFSKINKLTVEEAGRNLRYKSFNEVYDKKMEIHSSCKIAVAHNKNDRAETMLFNIARGSKLSGLHSIMPKQNNIIRPILCLSRSEIEEYLKGEGITPREDESNYELEYTRNKIRHLILPVMTELNDGAIAHMDELATSIARIEDYLVRQTKMEMGKVIVHRGESRVEIDVEAFKECDLVIREYIIREILYELSGGKKDITAAHIDVVNRLSDMQVSKTISLPYGLEARKDYSAISIYKVIEVKTESMSEVEVLLEDDVLEVGLDDGRVLTFEIVEYSKVVFDDEKSCKKHIDYDKIRNTLVIRSRKDDDYICIGDDGSKKKINRLMIDNKIPQGIRNNVPILVDGEEIVYVVGCRVSNLYKLDSKTKRVLMISEK